MPPRFFSLEEYLYNVDSSIDSVKLFLTDLFLQLKECINKIYNSSRISFPTNSAIIDYIGSCNYLYEIILYISGQVKSVMDSNDNSTRDSILEDILYYIDNNYNKISSLRRLPRYLDTTALTLASCSRRQSGKTLTPTLTTGASNILRNCLNARISRSMKSQSRSATKMWTIFTKNSRNMLASALRNTADNCHWTIQNNSKAGEKFSPATVLLYQCNLLRDNLI